MTEDEQLRRGAVDTLGLPLVAVAFVIAGIFEQIAHLPLGTTFDSGAVVFITSGVALAIAVRVPQRWEHRKR